MPHAARNTPCRGGRVCLACHGDRLATLLETASVFRLYRWQAATVAEEGSLAMPQDGVASLGALLVRAGVALLVCGGATCCCLRQVARHGVAVVPWIAGDVAGVLAALCENRLETLRVPGARPGPRAGRAGGRGNHSLEIEP